MIAPFIAEYFLELILIFSFTILFRYFINSKNGKAPLPPGPWGLPVLGYLPFLNDCTQFHFAELAKKYGPIFGFYAGNQYTVVLNDYDVTVEAFKKLELNNRPEPSFHIADDIPNIVGMNNPEWIAQRNMCVSHLRSFTKNENGLSIRQTVQEQTDCILKRLEEFCDQPTTNLRYILGEAATNVMSKFALGKDFNFEGPLSMEKFREFQIALLSQGSPKSSTLCFQWLAKILRRTLPYLVEKNNTEKIIKKMVFDEIEAHQTDLDSNDPRDFIDLYLLHMKKTNDPAFTINALNGHIQMMVIGGTDAVRATLEWLLLCLAKFPDIQQRVYQEVLEVIGTERRPEWEDKDNMPYTMATIWESQRFNTTVPVNGARCPSGDIVVKGYLIPKNTNVFSNIWAMNNDTTYWKNPEQFDPTRYLNKEGKFDSSKRQVAFSLGRRKCLGELQALIELFVFSTTIIQKFELLPPNGGVSLDKINHLVSVATKPYVKFEHRK